MCVAPHGDKLDIHGAKESREEKCWKCGSSYSKAHDRDLIVIVLASGRPFSQGVRAGI